MFSSNCCHPTGHPHIQQAALEETMSEDTTRNLFTDTI
jgi:hypothetical protein